MFSNRNTDEERKSEKYCKLLMNGYASTMVIHEMWILIKKMGKVVTALLFSLTIASLESKGYEVGYDEWSAGHNWTHWAEALADGVIFIYSR
jgi:enterochelin esterase-like enzyme